MNLSARSHSTSNDYTRAVDTHPDRHRAVFSMVVDGQRVWVKRSKKRYGTSWQKLLHIVTGSYLSPDIKLDHELAVMEQLRARGALVPEVLHREQDYMVLSDIGPTLHVLMQQNPPMDEKRSMLHKAATALRHLHRKDGWHGNPKLLDLTLHPTGVGFIDFEEATASKLPIEWLQARDLWLFAHSTVRFDATGQLAADALEHYGQKIQLRLLKRFAYWSLPLYALLWPLQNILGRDVRFALATTRAILNVHL